MKEQTLAIIKPDAMRAGLVPGSLGRCGRDEEGVPRTLARGSVGNEAPTGVPGTFSGGVYPE